MQTHDIEPALVALSSPDSFAAEQYQGLRLKLERLQQTHGVRAIAVTSPGVDEGKTVTAINLAAALARGPNARVLLVDADLRRPSIARHLGMDHAVDGGGPGLTDAIAGRVGDLLDVVQRTNTAHAFSVLPAGTVTADVHEQLRSPRLAQCLARARDAYDFVVLDTPPLVPVTDAAVLSRAVDGVLVVVAAHETPRKVLGEALSLLDESKTLGIVFNGDDRPLFKRYRAYYRQ